MGILGKLFGRRKPAPPAAAPAQPASEAAPEAQADIEVFDAYGRKLTIPRQEWRDKVLPSSIEAAWSDADKLYNIILQALGDGFRADLLEAAKHLHEIDPIPERGACLWAAVLLEEDRFREAGVVLQNHIKQHGETGVVLTNLARVQGAKGQPTLAEATLWKGLQLDPNQASGFGLAVELSRAKSEEPGAELACFQRIAALPGSWRAQVWLARAALLDGDLEGALALYKEALAKESPPPTELLQQMSGDLGKQAYLLEALELTVPVYAPELHGIEVGNNIIKSYLDLGQLDAAHEVHEQLCALARPDWTEFLGYWESEIAKARLEIDSPISPDELKIALLPVEGPIWLKPTSPAAELFPAKPGPTVPIAILSGTADIASNSQRLERQMADWRGRISRALPLYLAEQIEFRTTAKAVTLVPWVLNHEGGFVLTSEPHPDDASAAAAMNMEVRCDYAITIHLRTTSDPWIAEIRFIRAIDSRLLAEIKVPFSSEAPAADFHEITKQVLSLLLQETGAEPISVPDGYTQPAAVWFPDYLLRLEQLLAVRCNTVQGHSAGSTHLSGEREMLRGCLEYCLAHPSSISARILMAQMLWTMKHVRPEVLPEFSERMRLLQKEAALPEPAQSVIQRIFNDALMD